MGNAGRTGARWDGDIMRGDKKGVAGKLASAIRRAGSDEGSPVSRAFLPRNEGTAEREDRTAGTQNGDG
ncbi:hypothetical protein CFE70_010430 [Pyrenophora teres f. teres 0-1]